MKKLRQEKFKRWAYEEKDWNRLFSKRIKGLKWRKKDYVYLEQVYDLNTLEGTLLDVGCGFGDGILYLNNRYPDIYKFHGVDISTEAINKCIRKQVSPNITFSQHNILKKLKEKHDIVLCLQTLEHIEHPVIAIKNLIEVTKKLLIISTPNENKRDDKGHIWSFEPSDFSDLLSFHCLGQEEHNIFWTWRP